MTPEIKLPSKLNVNVAFGLPTLVENLARLAKHQQRNDDTIAYRLHLVALLLKGLEDDALWSQVKIKLKKAKGEV